MSTIRVVAGAGRGPTAVASYDAALADAGVHNYNLVAVSSVIPAESTVERTERAPNLGPVGQKLTVVEARATVETTTETGTEPGCAGLGWTVDERGRGLFYEGSGADTESVRETVEAGLAAGRDLREWSFVEERIVTETTDAGDGPPGTDDRAGDESYATAVVLATYGDSEPIL